MSGQQPDPLGIVCLLTSEPPEGLRGDCTDPELGYLEFHADAERRLERGEEPVMCKRCDRWRWALCPAVRLMWRFREFRLPISVRRRWTSRPRTTITRGTW